MTQPVLRLLQVACFCVLRRLGFCVFLPGVPSYTWDRPRRTRTLFSVLHVCSCVVNASGYYIVFGGLRARHGRNVRKRCPHCSCISTAYSLASPDRFWHVHGVLTERIRDVPLSFAGAHGSAAATDTGITPEALYAAVRQRVSRACSVATVQYFLLLSFSEV